jgi:hypothetical protein
MNESGRRHFALRHDAIEQSMNVIQFDFGNVLLGTRIAIRCYFLAGLPPGLASLRKRHNRIQASAA